MKTSNIKLPLTTSSNGINHNSLFWIVTNYSAKQTFSIQEPTYTMFHIMLVQASGNLGHGKLKKSFYKLYFLDVFFFFSSKELYQFKLKSCKPMQQFASCKTKLCTCLYLATQLQNKYYAFVVWSKTLSVFNFQQKTCIFKLFNLICTFLSYSHVHVCFLQV